MFNLEIFMKYRTILILIIVVSIMLVYWLSSDNVEKEQKENEERKEMPEVREDKSIQTKEVYEPIPIVENSGMLFESYSEADQWARENNIKKYEVKKCEWKWRNTYKEYGLNGIEYFTVKILE